MKKTILFFCYLLLGVGLLGAQTSENTLTKKESRQGWVLLFNGENLEGWHSVGRSTPPEKGWEVENGVLTVNKGGAKRGGDIITKSQYENFDLRFEFRITKGANSGIKYLFTRYEKGGWLGNEYQILDDEFHPDAKGGRDGNRKVAALYDILPTGKKTVKPTGEWNSGRIVVKGSKIYHYLNGKKVVSYNRESKAYLEALNLSKFNNVQPTFGTAKKGHILLQDHQDEVSYKNIKIREL